MRKCCNGTSLFFLILLFHAIWIFQGFDTTDFGFHLTNQVWSFRASVADGRCPPLLFLSDFAGGAWLSLAGGPSLLWARLGGVLLYSLNALVVYRTLATRFDRGRVFFVVFASTLFVTMRSMVTMVHYYTFPALLLNVALLLLDRMLTAEPGSPRSKVYAALLGALAVPIVLGRFPLVLIAVIPPVLVAYCLVVRQGLPVLKRAAPFALAGLLASLGLCGLLADAIGFLPHYVSAVRSLVWGAAGDDPDALPGGYQAGSLLQLYLNNAILTAQYMLFTAVLLLVLARLKEALRSKGQRMALALLAASGWLFLLSQTQIHRDPRLLILPAIGTVLALAAFFLWQDRGRDAPLGQLVLASVAVMAITPMGSNTGLWKACHGMWLALPLALLLAYRMGDRMRRGWLRSVCSLTTPAIGVMALTAAFYQFSNVYRDDPNRFHLDTPFRASGLGGIYSSGTRVRIVEEALAELRRRTDRGDTVLLVNSIPIFYYLTGTRPLFPEVWVVTRPLPRVEQLYREATERGELPKLFVVCRTNVRRPDWPTSQLTSPFTLPPLQYLMDRYTGEHGYVQVWQNQFCTFYAPPPQ